MDFTALHLKVLPRIRLRKDKENESNIFYLAQASLHDFPLQNLSTNPFVSAPQALGMSQQEHCVTWEWEKGSSGEKTQFWQHR